VVCNLLLAILHYLLLQLKLRGLSEKVPETIGVEMKSSLFMILLFLTSSSMELRFIDMFITSGRYNNVPSSP
jgi:uncharacterized membrane protein